LKKTSPFSFTHKALERAILWDITPTFFLKETTSCVAFVLFWVREWGRLCFYAFYLKFQPVEGKNKCLG